MYQYLMEIFEFGNDNGLIYYYLANSKTFTSEKEIKDQTYYKNNKYFVLSKLNIIDETERKKRKSR